MALLFLLSAQPGLRVSDDASVDRPLRQVAHIVSYGVLAVLLARALAGGWAATPRPAALAVVLAIFYGVTDELHQATVPSRTGQLADVVWDGVGALIGVAVLLGARRIR
jgi:VanZ family protein